MARPHEPEEAAQLAAAIDRVAGTFTALWEHAHEFPDLTVSATQLRALFIVDRLDGVNLSGLATELAATLPSTSRLCDRLEAGGLLVRDSGLNRREILVRLSADGRALLGQVRQVRQAVLAETLMAMPAPARTALLTGLTHFHSALAAEEPQARSSSAGERA